MNKAYFIIKDEGRENQMYHCWGNGMGNQPWTFNISKANHWPTDEGPKFITANQDYISISVVAITKTEYFKRILQGK